MSAPPPPPAWQQPAPATDPTKAVLAHVGGLVIGFLAPLIVFLISDNDPYAKAHAKEALNFHISFLLWSIVSFVAMIVIIGIFMLLAVGVLYVVFQIVAAVNASRWQHYRYPLTIRFLQ